MIYPFSQMNRYVRSSYFRATALTAALALATTTVCAGRVEAAPPSGCGDLPPHEALKTALVAARGQKNGGLDNDMWGAVVNRDGVVCAVTFTGKERGNQWPGSRLIAAEKAFTANAFSLPAFAVSTANLYFSSQPAGALFGLIQSHPIDTGVAYGGNPADFGQEKDPLVGKTLGGVVVFGGGLALYNKEHVLLGALGVSGDTSCADHNVAWRTRKGLNLDFVPAGVTSSKTHPDNIVYDIVRLTGHAEGLSPSTWGHPACNSDVPRIAEELPAISR